MSPCNPSLPTLPTITEKETLIIRVDFKGFDPSRDRIFVWITYYISINCIYNVKMHRSL